MARKTPWPPHPGQIPPQQKHHRHTRKLRPRISGSRNHPHPIQKCRLFDQPPGRKKKLIGPDLSRIEADPSSLFYAEQANHSLLTAEEEVELIRRYKRGDADALPALIYHNTRLIIGVAIKFLGRGVELLDLVQEGRLGLLKALRKFEPHRGLRLSTYATWWIRQAVQRAVADQGRTIRLPVHRSAEVNRVYSAIETLRQRLGRLPNLKELADHSQLPPTKIKLLLKISLHPVSLNDPVGDAGSERGDFLPDESASPEETAFANLRRREIEKTVNRLPPREAKIITLRYGLKGQKTHTLEETGQKFGLTRERIRQIEAQALRHLRHPRHTRKLKKYSD